MGLYDSLYVRCPKCRTRIEFQSKAGHCTELSDVPPVIAIDLDGDEQRCPECSSFVKLRTQAIAVVSVDFFDSGAEDTGDGA